MKHSEILKQAKIRQRSLYETFGRGYICNSIKGLPHLGNSSQRTEIISFINDSMKKDARDNTDRYFINEYGIPYWLYLKGCIKAKRIEYNSLSKYFDPDIDYTKLQNYRQSFIDELIRIYKAQGK